VSANLQRRALQRIAVAGSVLLALTSVGATGYYWLEGLSPLDALYMTVITLSTVGFGEIKPLSTGGRLFTIGLILGGASVAAYLLSSAAELLFSTDLRRAWEQQRRNRMLAKLSNHVIVCGYGRVGRSIVHALQAEGQPFVVIDLNPERVERLEAEGVLALAGNAANETRLKEAGLERARALMVAANSDAENVFIVLTARSLRPDLFIVARANFEETESKLLKAGANRVILPYRIAGRRMVTMLMRPAVVDFLDEVAHAGGLELLLEQVPIAPGSALAGRTLGEAQLRTRLDVNVLACRAPDGSLLSRPNGHTQLTAGMELIVLGADARLQELRKLAHRPSEKDL